MADEQLPTVEIAPTVVISNSDNEVPASQTEILEAEAIEQVTDSAVEIARIEADKEITIAAIHADVETTAIEANTNAKSEVEECREEVNRLAGIVEALMEQVNSLIPPLPQEIAETEELQTVTEPDLIQPYIAAQTLETETEPSAESVEERVEAEIPKRVRRFTAI